MSLRKSTSLTPRRVDAARHNAERSTGPRSEAGKERMKMNALKHGCDAAAENEAAVMRALGEDPGRFAALKRELAAAYGPGDALWDRQIDDLARLYWRRQRMERMETGMMRRAQQGVEERVRARRSQIDAATFDALSSLATDLKLAVPADPCVRLRQLLSRLGAIREQFRQGIVTGWQHLAIEKCYRGGCGWRPTRLLELILMFANRASCQAKKDKQGLNEVLHEMGGEANVDTLWRELLRLLEEEIAAVESAFEEEMKAQEEKDAIERDACLAPAGETWAMLARQEMALDRSIDRKVKILLTLRREQDRLRKADSPTASRKGDDGPPGDRANDREAQELSKLVGLDAAQAAPALRSASAGLKASAASERPTEVNTLETSKSPEQSQNVIENNEITSTGVIIAT